MTTMSRLAAQRKRLVPVITLGIAGAMMFSACAEPGNAGTQSAGEGVAYGASKEDYQAAFNAVEPIKVVTQTPAPKGSLTGKRFEDYYAAVEDWSGGKITFDIQYANAVAGAVETDNAIADGRLDLASVLPLYEPAQYPANDALVSTLMTGPQFPVVGYMALHGWAAETALGTPAIVDEFTDNGMHVLIPAFTSGSTGIMCSGESHDTLSKLKGAQISAGSKSLTQQMKALDATPVSVAYTELFESLQRGAVDCAASSLLVGSLGAFIPAAPHVVLDTEVGLGQQPGALVMSTATWEKLPLVAQQLMHDRLDVFLNSMFHSTWQTVKVAVDQVLAEGGEIVGFDEETRATLATANKDILDGLRQNKAVGDGGAFVDKVLDSSERWVGIAGELGYTDEADYNGFGAWYAEDKVDTSGFVDRLFVDVLNNRRPS